MEVLRLHNEKKTFLERKTHFVNAKPNIFPPVGQQEDEEDAGGGAASEERAGEDCQASFKEHERPDLGRDEPLRSVRIRSTRNQTEFLRPFKGPNNP